MKICSKCLKKKELDQFYKSKVAKDGHNWYCKECSSKYHKVYRAWPSNKEKLKEYNLENKEKIREKRREYNTKNKEKIEEYRAKNKEKIKEQAKEYRRKKKEEKEANKTVGEQCQIL